MLNNWLSEKKMSFWRFKRNYSKCWTSLCKILWQKKLFLTLGISYLILFLLISLVFTLENKWLNVMRNSDSRNVQAISISFQEENQTIDIPSLSIWPRTFTNHDEQMFSQGGPVPSAPVGSQLYPELKWNTYTLRWRHW